MKGSIRIIVGFLIAFGAVGSLEQETIGMFPAVIAAAIGLFVMYSGVRASQNV